MIKVPVLGESPKDFLHNFSTKEKFRQKIHKRKVQTMRLQIMELNLISLSMIDGDNSNRKLKTRDKFKKKIRKILAERGIEK